MPTYFGPTNIPPLEAFLLGCPVLYSDLPLLREQVLDAALLLDLSNPESLAEKIMTLLQDSELQKKLSKKGKAIIAECNEQDFWLILKKMTCLTMI